MPLPNPRPGEAEESYISRCMSSEVMNKEFPDSDQRYAVCKSEWGRRKTSRRPGVESGRSAQRG